MKRRIQSSPFNAYCQYVVKFYTAKKSSETKISVKFILLLPRIWGLEHLFWRLSEWFYGKKTRSALKHAVHYSILISLLPARSTAQVSSRLVLDREILLVIRYLLYFLISIFLLALYFENLVWKVYNYRQRKVSNEYHKQKLLFPSVCLSDCVPFPTIFFLIAASSLVPSATT